ncbi:MAG: threonylcarbamoyl-AMP synthase [Actinobacteria bacterium]|nr:threonylcarbamoyl-AMP synthase [Actinomycetota bacterium]
MVAASGHPPPEDAMERAAEALRGGEVVVVPTDTVYGLAVVAALPGATARLFALKGRPGEVALPVLVADVDQALALAGDDLPAAALRMMRRWWPGPLTVVVRRRGGLGLDLGGTDDASIGLRVPAHPVPRGLAARVGPLAVTSANLHGCPTPVTAAGVVEHLGAGVGLVLDAGESDGAPSTVVSCLGDELRLLRAGHVPFAHVIAVAAGPDGTEIVQGSHHDEAEERPR